MIAWAGGKAAAALARFMLDTGAATYCRIDYGTGLGYWTAINLSREGYPHTVGLDAVTFTRKAP